MAIVSGNMLTTGLRGKVGQMIVFRVIRGKTFASRAPRKPDKRKETAAQRSTRVTFKEASHWAKAVLLDPEKKKYFQQRAKVWDLPNAYTAAVKTYMCNPQATKDKQEQSVPESSVSAATAPVQIANSIHFLSSFSLPGAIPLFRTSTHGHVGQNLANFRLPVFKDSTSFSDIALHFSKPYEPQVLFAT